MLTARSLMALRLSFAVLCASPAAHSVAQSNVCQPATAYSSSSNYFGDRSVRKIAIVVGNNSYPGDNLQEAITDAKSIAHALEMSGFKVLCLLDAASTHLEKAIKLAVKHMEAGDDREDLNRVVFYFAGHGQRSLNGDDHIKLVDSDSRETVAGIAKKLKFPGKYDPVLIIDACRTRQMAVASAAPKFAYAGAVRLERYEPTRIDRDHAVFHSTDRNKTATDNQPTFTSMLVPYMRAFGRSLASIADASRRDFIQVTSGWQQPEYEPRGFPSLQVLLKPENACAKQADTVLWFEIDKFCKDWPPVKSESGKPLTCLERLNSRQLNLGIPKTKCQELREYMRPLRSLWPSCFGDVQQIWDDYLKPACGSLDMAVALESATPGSRLPKLVLAEGAPFTSLTAALAGEVAGADLQVQRGPFAKITLDSPTQTVGANAKLYRLPDSGSEVVDIVVKGGTVAFDCQTLKCDKDWIGVRAPQVDGKVVRGFLPIDLVAPYEHRIDFAAGSTDVSRDAERQLLTLLARYPDADLETTAVRVWARQRPQKTEDNRADERLLARQRASQIATLIRLAGFGKVTIEEGYLDKGAVKAPDVVVEITKRPSAPAK